MRQILFFEFSAVENLMYCRKIENTLVYSVEW